jgi:(2Fe-2S) ferredoxin
VDNLIKAYLLPNDLHPTQDSLSGMIRERVTRDEACREDVYGVQDINSILVLICGHGGRDARCGIYGPVLRNEFEKALEAYNFKISKDSVQVPSNPDTNHENQVKRKDNQLHSFSTAQVGLISHIGGHKFAGNTIVYLPPTLKNKEGGAHALAGCGIWYGRVEPKHVNGIVRETILGGKVIEELFRGGIRPHREIMRL